MKERFQSKKNQSNKFWSYETTGPGTVLVSWGRVGTSGSSQSKTFSSSAARDAFIDKKVREKTQGEDQYERVTEAELEKETRTANQIGAQNKIQRICWTDMRSPSMLATLPEYDPDKFVYVEILNSWSKQTTHLLLNRNQSWELDGAFKEGSTIRFQNRTTSTQTNFVQAVRTLLRETAQAVATACRTLTIGGMGHRALFDDDTQDLDAVPELAGFKAPSISPDVIRAFARMGERTLTL